MSESNDRVLAATEREKGKKGQFAHVPSAK